MSQRQRFPFPYVPNGILVMVDGTVQPITDVDPDDPDGGTFDLPEDPLDGEVWAYARVSPDAVPSPPVFDDGGDEEIEVLEDPDDDYEEDEDVVDADDDETEESDPDAPAYPDD